MSKRIVLAVLFLAVLAFAAVAQGAAQGAASSSAAAWKYISAALAVGFACIGGGIAVGKLGAAAMGPSPRTPASRARRCPTSV